MSEMWKIMEERLVRWKAALARGRPPEHWRVGRSAEEEEGFPPGGTGAGARGGEAGGGQEPRWLEALREGKGARSDGTS